MIQNITIFTVSLTIYIRQSTSNLIFDIPMEHDGVWDDGSIEEEEETPLSIIDFGKHEIEQDLPDELSGALRALYSWRDSNYLLKQMAQLMQAARDVCMGGGYDFLIQIDYCLSEKCSIYHPVQLIIDSASLIQ